MSNNGTRLEAALSSAGLIQGRDYMLAPGVTLSDCFGRNRLTTGESYMEGLWRTQHLPYFFGRLAKNPPALFRVLGAAAQRGEVVQSAEATAEHYAVVSKIAKLMLGSVNVPPIYTCGWWVAEGDTLEQAQVDKLVLLCQMLHLKQGERVLDIGGGWGGFAYFAAKYFGVTVDVITIVEEQKEYGEKACEGLPVTFHFLDYRHMTIDHFGSKPFDKVITVEMIEHVGLPAQHVVFHQKVAQVLKPGGLLLHQVITTEWPVVDQFIDKYIFPGGVLLTLTEVEETSGQAGFTCLRTEEISEHYPPTLLAWRRNFLSATEELLRLGFTWKTLLKFDFYFSLCAALFQSKFIQLHHILLQKK